MEQSATLRLSPIVHVGNIAASIAFYEALGGKVSARSRDDDFAQIQIGGGEIGLLAHPPNPEQGEDYIELCFSTTSDLATLEKDLRAAHVTIVQAATDQEFGAQLQIESPDGTLIKINRIDPSTFT